MPRRRARALGARRAEGRQRLQLTSAERFLGLVQHRLEGFYQLERGPAVREFVSWRDGGREVTLVRATDDGIELAVVLPRAIRGRGIASRDEVLQLVEGVSHFRFLVERARTDLPTTHLELELQAEVDKFVVLSMAAPARAGTGKRRARRVHDALYGQVRFVHPVGTELGDRYRLANDLAARMMRRVIDRVDPAQARGLLRRFYRAGQAEKIRVATTALP